jgi:hypothetical protein
MVQISYYIKFFTFAKNKLELSKLTKVIISLLVVVVGTYDEPLICLTDDGKFTVPEPVVLNNMFTV